MLVVSLLYGLRRLGIKIDFFRLSPPRKTNPAGPAVVN
jgi:hypothetical protein